MIFSKLYDESGKIDTQNYVSFLILEFIVLYLIFIIFSFYIINMQIINPIDILINYYNYMINQLINSYPSFENIDSKLIVLNIFALVFIIPFIVISMVLIRRFAKIQMKLSNMALEGYSIVYFWNNEFIFKPRNGNKMKYDKFIKQFADLSQLFEKGNVRFKRHASNGVRVIFRYKTPSIRELKNLNASEYLKDEHIFLGFRGGEKKKIEPLYVHINKILHSAFLGVAGKGKSNTLNQFLLSIFKNFNKYIGLFVFVDFKGGIEANTYRLLEEELRTEKIEVYDNDRLSLYKLLKRLKVINIARQYYIRDNYKKKITDNLIFLVFDEVAAILKYEPTNKEMKIMQKEIIEMIDELYFIGRSQGFRIIASTQSYVGNASGLTGLMKLNTETKFQHFAEEDSALKAFAPEPLKMYEQGIDPREFSTGEFCFKSEGSNYLSARSLYIEEDVLKLKDIFKSIVLSNESFNQEQIDIKMYFKEIINNFPNSDFYSNSELLKDLMET